MILYEYPFIKKCINEILRKIECNWKPAHNFNVNKISLVVAFVGSFLYKFKKFFNKYNININKYTFKYIAEFLGGLNYGQKSNVRADKIDACAAQIREQRWMGEKRVELDKKWAKVQKALERAGSGVRYRSRELLSSHDGWVRDAGDALH